MEALKAHVKDGRLVLDEPTDLPDGEVIELVPLDEVLARGGDYLDEDERAELHRAIDDGSDDFETGNTVDAFEFLARLRSEREDRDRQAGPGTGQASK